MRDDDDLRISRSETTDPQLVSRYDALLDVPLDARGWVEIGALHNELAFRVHAWRVLGWGQGVDPRVVEAFSPTGPRAASLERSLAAASFAEPEVRASRRSYLQQVMEARVDSSGDPSARLTAARAAFEDDLHAVIDRLSGGRTPGSAQQRLLALAAEAPPAIRRRLRLLPAEVGRRHADLPRRLDALVAARHDTAAALGRRHPLEPMLEGLRLDQAELMSWVTEVVRAAAAVRERGTGDGLPLSDVELVGRRPDPDAGATLRFDRVVASFADRAAADLDVRIRPSRSNGDLVLGVLASDGREGAVVVRASAHPVARTMALRNRTRWPGLDQTPIACSLLELPGDGALTLTQARVLFHELGHGLQHVLWRRNLSNLAGLEFVPTDRSELLSQVCEMWTHRPSTLASAWDDGASSGPEHTFAWVRHQLTVLARAALAWVDVAIHTRPGLGVEAAVDELRSRVALPPDLEVVRLAAALAEPRHVARPGSAFAYAWGAARAADLVTRGVDPVPESTVPTRAVVPAPPDAEMTFDPHVG